MFNVGDRVRFNSRFTVGLQEEGVIESVQDLPGDGDEEFIIVCDAGGRTTKIEGGMEKVAA